MFVFPYATSILFVCLCIPSPNQFLNASVEITASIFSVEK
jgi:hypothetical protein